MRRAAMTAVLAMAMASGCEGDPPAYPPPAMPFKCDAGEVVAVKMPPNLTCVPADGGVETDASAD
jgi:hypothetical protein